MTAEEKSRVTRFLNRFNRVEGQLRRKLGLARDAGGFTQVIKRFNEAFPLLVDTESLRTLAAVRNALVHESFSDSDFCVVPTQTLIRQLDEICDCLIAPLRVLPTFRK